MGLKSQEEKDAEIAKLDAEDPITVKYSKKETTGPTNPYAEVDTEGRPIWKSPYGQPAQPGP
jgi:hypothetical protein